MIYLQLMNYNLDIAKVFGPCSAIFLSCLDMENAFHKRNTNNDSSMSLTRAEIYERTALDDEKQHEIEIALQECGVLIVKPLKNIPNKNYYIINEEQLFKIMQSNNPTEIIGEEKSKQFIQKPRVEPINKRQSHIIQLKKRIKVDDPIIQTYLIDWIDAVYSNPKGFLSPTGIDIAQQELKAYSGDNQEKAINILKIAIKGGLRDLTWAIEQYESKSGANSNNFANYSDIKADINNASEEIF